MYKCSPVNRIDTRIKERDVGFIYQSLGGLKCNHLTKFAGEFSNI